MDVEIEQPHRHHSTGHAWLDKILPLSALLISIVSIAIAFHHGKVMEALVQQNERLVQANSLPYLTFGADVQISGGSGGVRLTIANKGVGPAELRYAKTSLDGKPIDDFSKLLADCCLSKGEANLSFASLKNTMLRPGDTTIFAAVEDSGGIGGSARRFAEAYVQRRIVTDVCYCSVFGECWMASTRPGRPQRIAQCPVSNSPEAALSPQLLRLR